MSHLVQAAPEHDVRAVRDNPKNKYNGNEAAYVLQALNSEDPNVKEHPFVGRLEQAVAERFGVKYAIAHNSGTSTLHSLLTAAGVGAGDEVISPAQTVIMPSFVTLYQNAIPVYADIDSETWNIDPADVERKITPRTRAIIAVHMQGLPADMDAIMDIARRHNLFVIEDSAQCMLSQYRGRLAGTIGHATSFSFETKKHISCGEGGMVITNDEDLATRVRKVAGLGYKTLAAGNALRAILPEEFQDPGYRRHDTLGWNYRMNEVSAAVALGQFERVDQLVARRQHIAQLYLEALNGCSWLKPPRIDDGVTHSYWTFPVTYHGDEALGVPWKEFWRRHKAAGGHGFYAGHAVAYQEIVMQTKPFTKGYLPDLPQYQSAFNYPDGLCPVAESVQARLMQFKTDYRDLEEAQEQANILARLIDNLGRQV